ncbi:NADH-quinone oxidoreductase subunit NuoI [Sulfurimonas sp.]|jgi:NADH-quinone oxidoreductase subunit I|uniref:NADH-quinone oxidoreductase subunit NuoI n=1 Tax=Sulfurimonas sp. TaxID=2022749 RepID=UPI0025D7930F|nr:NADH-quinone oxidoreductase subunit NuoI [Sulfurimonas sp.]MBT5934729.1 NADH-quinone oxidoreductase subunit NuoI [Sulfurimonas sp.]
MNNEQFNNRNVSENGYFLLDIEDYPTDGWGKFQRVVKRTFRGELFVGLWVVLREMIKFDIHTISYPAEKMPIGPRYRGVHEMKRLWESDAERCIGCGLCEKICISDCIRMDTKIDENSRKEVSSYTINLGRCIFCGYCAEVCPELAITHGGEYEIAADQRASFIDYDHMLTPIDTMKANAQKEFEGFGAITPNEDAGVKKSPLSY